MAHAAVVGLGTGHNVLSLGLRGAVEAGAGIGLVDGAAQ